MKKKRRLPSHIVLPNGMWRFVKSGSKKAKVNRVKVARKIRVKRKRGVFSMARFKKRRVSRGRMGGLVGRGSLMSGLVRPKGLLESALVGYAVADVINSPIAAPIQGIPFIDYAGAFATAGVGGVLGAAARNMLSGKPLIGGHGSSIAVTGYNY